MKRILMLAILLLGLAGCQSAPSAEAQPTLQAIMAEAEESIPAETAPESVQWDGEYTNGVRSFTLSLLGEDGLHYRVSDGSEGHAPEVNGAAAKAETLLFSLSGDTLSVVGDAYTGNYERK